MVQSKECANEVGRFLKHEDEAYGEGYAKGWNERGEVEPNDIRRETCTMCRWYVGKGQCAKRYHRACPDWESVSE